MNKKVREFKFGFYKESNYKGWTEQVLTFDNSSRSAFEVDYKRQVNKLISTPVYELQIVI